MSSGTGILSFLDPDLSCYVDALHQPDADLGVLGGTIRVVEPKCGRITQNPRNSCDRFKVTIPYGGNSLTWQVIFDSLHPSLPPDFIFDAHDRTFAPELDQLKCLVNWDHTEPKSLVFALRELLSQYKTYQENLLCSNARLQFEYVSLIETTQFTDIEVHQIQKSSYARDSVVNFLIKLPVDFKDIPAYLIKDNPGNDIAILLVSFQGIDGNKVSPQLFLSPRVERALGGTASLRIPAFSNRNHLTDYTGHILELLQNLVEQVVKGYQKRKEFVAALLSHYGRSCLEYDSEGFSKASFLFEMQDFHFILHVRIPSFFPREQPEFVFQSVYHTTSLGKPFQAVVSNYPYSPRWSGNEMAERAKVFMEQYIQDFKRSSVTSGRFT
ncbi:BRISC and BRCA1-A complex member 2-like [Lytechinus variegatus]|uniref:BRISC and BRCA1-A complex member 2-like n=1 Tax=Lytechinus variegatus TaxID=7654 RepID=UPI001BB17E37|nr:BRISC and BRCA1-A complex member 2-like [Lytechinus variegatus]